MQICPTSSSPVNEPYSAEEQSNQNWSANNAALAVSQRWIVGEIQAADLEVTWLLARDGSLTAMDQEERWWAGCSVPRRAAEFMFKQLEIPGTVACFLSPVHAAQIRVALDKLQPQQAILAIVPEARTLAVILRCDDFSSDIAAHRLWFVTGEQWAIQMERLFEENPGLPTPSQFIRPILADAEPADRLIAPAQKTFAETGGRRTARIQSLTAAQNRDPGKIDRLCVIAPSQFRLWDDAGTVLETLSDRAEFKSRGISVRRFDSDDPASTSPLALALAAAECDALIAPNLSRAGAPGVTPSKLPWITWVTTPRIPPADGAGPHDRLLLADPAWREPAEKAGWSRRQLRIAQWPAPASQKVADTLLGLALVSDTQPLDPPEQVTDYSSHVLLWELIRDELTRDPFLLTENVEKYLDSRRIKLQIAESGFDAGLFIDRLIIPAYQQGLARVLIDADVPVRLFGRGWDQIDPFAAISGGSVDSRQQFDQIIATSAALVHAWPTGRAHPIDAARKPVVRAIGRRRDAFLRDAQLAPQGKLPATRFDAADVLCPELILQIITAL